MRSGFKIKFFNMIGESFAKFSKQDCSGDILPPFLKGQYPGRTKHIVLGQFRNELLPGTHYFPPKAF